MARTVHSGHTIRNLSLSFVSGTQLSPTYFNRPRVVPKRLKSGSALVLAAFESLMDLTFVAAILLTLGWLGQSDLSIILMLLNLPEK